MIDWKFTNEALKSLPIDPLIEAKAQVRTVRDSCYSLVNPTPIENPKVVAYSASALELLFTASNDKPYLNEKKLLDSTTIGVLSGNMVADTSQPAAHCYCGFQFGSFAGQLGDGAAIYLGDKLNDLGVRWEVQLKGAGKTPYSRNADGRKVLRSSIREFLASEANFYLKVPTTRAGSCITSDSKVMRDILYAGHPIFERCTVVSRIAPTFLRFGSFQISLPCDPETGRTGPSFGNNEIIAELVKYSVKNFFPNIKSRYFVFFNGEVHTPEMLANITLDFLKEVVKLTAELVAHWQSVGFCHGVLNTDNMSILGLTIDYGPFGFMEYFDSNYICNSSDDGGRYSYKEQPEICRWNCEKLLFSLEPLLLVNVNQTLNIEQLKLEINDLYKKSYGLKFNSLMRKKLGLFCELSDDEKFFETLFETMEKSSIDFTSLFRILSIFSGQAKSLDEFKLDENLTFLANKLAVEFCASVDTLKTTWVPKFNKIERQQILSFFKGNLAKLQRMGGAGLLLDEELENKRSRIEKLTCEEKQKMDARIWYDWLKQYVLRLQADVERIEDSNNYWTDHIEIMQSNNPYFIPRNYWLQMAIEAAENDDFSLVNQLLSLFKEPFAPYSQNFATERLKLPTFTNLESCSKTKDPSIEEIAATWSNQIRVS